jgi:hypothetical protein
MLFRRIYRSFRKSKPAARARRSEAERRLQFEPLEGRSLLSTGLTIDPGATPVSLPAKSGAVELTGPSPALEAPLGSGGFDPTLSADTRTIPSDAHSSASTDATADPVIVPLVNLGQSVSHVFRQAHEPRPENTVERNAFLEGHSDRGPFTRLDVSHKLGDEERVAAESASDLSDASAWRMDVVGKQRKRRVLRLQRGEGFQRQLSKIASGPYRGSHVVELLKEQALDHSLASIKDGNTLVSIVHSTDVPMESSSAGLEQIAELSPAKESSSLALVATLWAAPSDTQKLSPGRDRPLDARNEGLDRATSLSSLTEFVIGLDEALEEGYRDAREGLFSSAARSALGQQEGGALEDQLEWRGAIVPAPGEMLDTKAGYSRTGGPAPLTEAIHSLEAEAVLPSRSSLSASDAQDGSVRSQRAAKHNAHDGLSAAEDAVSVLSAVTASTLIAGWCWTKRARGPFGVSGSRFRCSRHLARASEPQRGFGRTPLPACGSLLLTTGG